MLKGTENGASYKSSYKSYKAFTKRFSYPKNYAVYEDDDLIKKARGRNTSVLIDLSKQRIKLIINGIVAIDSPATTGKNSHATPTGTHRIMEKIKKGKRSNRYGRLLLRGKMVHGGDRRKYKGKYDKYEGAKMNYWMRLTGDGVGIHHSNFIKRFPLSHGCIRVPNLTIAKIFKAVRVGSKVRVIGSAKNIERKSIDEDVKWLPTISLGNSGL